MREPALKFPMRQRQQRMPFDPSSGAVAAIMGGGGTITAVRVVNENRLNAHLFFCFSRSPEEKDRQDCRAPNADPSSALHAEATRDPWTERYARVLLAVVIKVVAYAARLDKDRLGIDSAARRWFFLLLSEHRLVVPDVPGSAPKPQLAAAGRRRKRKDLFSSFFLCGTRVKATDRISFFVTAAAANDALVDERHDEPAAAAVGGGPLRWRRNDAPSTAA